MIDDEPHWTTLASRSIPVGRWSLEARDVLLPDGSTIEFVLDVGTFAVAALLVVDGDVLLSRQYRYPVDRWIHDLPAGGGHPDEEPFDAIRREVEEELGLIPTDLVPLHTFYSNPGRSSWPVHLFFGTAVEPGRAVTTDAAEQVRLARMPLTEFDALLASGGFVDPTLIVARTMAAAKGLLPPVGE